MRRNMCAYIRPGKLADFGSGADQMHFLLLGFQMHFLWAIDHHVKNELPLKPKMHFPYKSSIGQ